MNLLEHYIKEVHSVMDETERFKDLAGNLPKNPIYKIDLTYDCYGAIGRKTEYFCKPEWEEAQEKGFFMA